MGLLGIFGVKFSFDTLHALMAKIESKDIDLSISYVPLCDVKPELMSYEAAMTSQYREVRERGMLAELEGTEQLRIGHKICRS